MALAVTAIIFLGLALIISAAVTINNYIEQKNDTEKRRLQLLERNPSLFREIYNKKQDKK